MIRLKINWRDVFMLESPKHLIPIPPISAMSQLSNHFPSEPHSDGSEQIAMSIESSYPLTFSQRNRYDSLPKPMRLTYLSNDLRRELCDLIYEFLKVMTDAFFNNKTDSRVIFVEPGQTYVKNILGRIKNCPKNRISQSFEKNIEFLQITFCNEKFNILLDYLEIMMNELAIMIHKDEDFADMEKEYSMSDFVNGVSDLFIKHYSAYWLDISQYPYQFYPRVSKEQGEATQQAIETVRQGRMDGASTHLRQAAEHINMGQYADSVADSIRAVESVARIIDPASSKTLGPALDSLERAGLLKHNALKEGFKKIYGYTSDEEGIRHALLDQSKADVSLDEAVFMFGACASFAAYLTRNHQKAKT